MSDTVLYHIGNDGTPKICKAKIQCKLGGSSPDDPKYAQHFTSPEAAQKYADEINENQSKLSINKLTVHTQENAFNNRNSLENKIFKAHKSKAAGLKTEIFLMTSYAQKQKMNNVLVKTKNGFNVVNKNDESVDEKIINKLKEKAYKIVETEYGLANPEQHIKSIYFNPDSPDKMVLHLGSSNMLDGAYIDKDGYKLMELKKGHDGGSQISEVMLGMNSDGNFDVPDNVMNPLIKEAIEKGQYKQSAKGNQYDLKVDEYASMWQFVESYKLKGASELLITDRDGKATSINLDRDIDKVVDELRAQDYVVKLKIRMNQTVRSITTSERHTFLRDGARNYYNGNPEFGPNGTFIKLENFNFKNRDITKRNKKEYYKFGNFVFPIPVDQINKMDPKTPIPLNDFKTFIPVFSGDIKKRPTRY